MKSHKKTSVRTCLIRTSNTSHNVSRYCSLLVQVFYGSVLYKSLSLYIEKNECCIYISTILLRFLSDVRF